MKRRLFSHERELQSWHSMTLTTHRVIHLESQQGFDGSTSIPLEHLQWTRIDRSHRPIYLIATGLLTILGMFTLGNGAKDLELGLLSLLAAIFMAVAYIATRKATLSLASGGGKIELSINAGDANRQQARDFLDAIEDAASHANQRSRTATMM